MADPRHVSNSTKLALLSLSLLFSNICHIHIDQIESWRVEDNQKKTRARHIPIAVNRARHAANFAIQSFRKPPPLFLSCPACRVHVSDPFSKSCNYQKCTAGLEQSKQNRRFTGVKIINVQLCTFQVFPPMDPSRQELKTSVISALAGTFSPLGT